MDYEFSKSTLAKKVVFSEILKIFSLIFATNLLTISSFFLHATILVTLVSGVYIARKCFQKYKDRKRNVNIVPIIQAPSLQFNNCQWNPELVTSKNLFFSMLVTLFLSVVYVLRFHKHGLTEYYEKLFFRIICNDILPPFCISFIIPLTLYINNPSLRTFFFENIIKF